MAMMADPKSGRLDATVIEALVTGRHGDPFSVLGPQGDEAAPHTLRAMLPGAQKVTAVKPDGASVLAELQPLHKDGLFEGAVRGLRWGEAYRLRVQYPFAEEVLDDPYRFPPLLGEMDVYLLAEGKHLRLHEKLGAHPLEVDGVAGTYFAVWAPNAQRVSVVGPFNHWDGRRHVMRKRYECGVWELFVPDVGQGVLYKFEIVGADGALMPLKADPLAFQAEMRPDTASIVHGPLHYSFDDQTWQAEREQRVALDAPVSIYEVHLGSWRRDPHDPARFLTYLELADQLVAYVQEMGFTHVEFLPVSEFPFDGSWGYQPVGLFAPTARFGPPEDFCALIERFHQAGIGVLIDWVPGHFPSDAHGLGEFDGTALYEHSDPRQGFHKDWNTLIYNYGRNEVANFLHANALYWLESCHIDGLRVDAVASMLYLDYSREADEWVPNKHGGNENLEAIAFLRRMNELTYGEVPGTMTVAEESTAWPGVSRPTYTGGLGFGYKWNMGWMHDTLAYMQNDPIHRRYHHHQLTFGLLYAFSENFVLPLSHDEVVHGKGSILGRMPGDRWQRFANLRAYYGFMFAHPGKKLNFMGGEFGQEREWNFEQGLDWHLLDDEMHRGVHDLFKDLNWTYRHSPALHERDASPEGFEWIEANDHEHSVLSFLRKGEDEARPVVVVCNFTPLPRDNYRVGVSLPGYYAERINTDSASYGGSNVGNAGGLAAEEISVHGRPYSLNVTLPPLATVIFERQAE